MDFGFSIPYLIEWLTCYSPLSLPHFRWDWRVYDIWMDWCYWAFYSDLYLGLEWVESCIWAIVLWDNVGGTLFSRQEVTGVTQTPSQGRASLPPSVPMKLPFYTHLPLRLSQPLEVGSGLLSSLQDICAWCMDIEEEQGVANINQNSPEGRSQLPSWLPFKTASLLPLNASWYWIVESDHLSRLLWFSLCFRM